MANPFVLFEDLYSLSGAVVSITSAVSGYPKENMRDWRMGTAYRWKATSTADQNYDVDLGDGTGGTPGAKLPNTVVIAGHDLYTRTATFRVYHSDNGSSWTAAAAAFTPVNNLPVFQTFTADAATHRYWRITFASLDAACQVGIVTLGRRLSFTAGALPDLDPYGVQGVLDTVDNENGSPIGVNVRYKRKQFTLNYGPDGAGMTATDFFAPVSGLGFDADFIPHAVDSGKPFWFNWNYDVDANDEVYLCRLADGRVSMPFVNSTARRGLLATFTAYSEIA